MANKGEPEKIKQYKFRVDNEGTSYWGPQEKEMINRIGKILNEEGEWVEYVEQDDPDRPPIAFDYMGSEGLPISPDDEVVDFCMQYRIPKIEGLTECKNLKKLGLRKNLVEKIEGIENCNQLIELELYDNRVKKLENINHLSNLVILDMAFNVIKEITPGSMDGLVNLKKLYLSANKIKKIQGLQNLKSIECLDIGDNKLRKIENLEGLTTLTELHLAKNKLQVIENIGHLKKLYMLTLQANFIEEITGLEELVNLEQLYFQQNKIKKISGLQTLTKLEIFDVAINEVTQIEGLESCAETLDELWINNNQIGDWKCMEYIGKTMKNLSNIYLAGNGVYQKGEAFKQKLKAAVPCLKQLEGSPFDRPVYMYQQPAGVSGIFKKGINPKAKAILEDIIGKTAADDYQQDIEQQIKDESKN